MLRATGEKQQITYNKIPIRITADLSAQTLQARREWQNIFEVMKRRNLEPRIFYSAKLSFRLDGQIKSFSNKQKLGEFSTSKPALQQLLRTSLSRKEKATIRYKNITNEKAF